MLTSKNHRVAANEDLAVQVESVSLVYYETILRLSDVPTLNLLTLIRHGSVAELSLLVGSGIPTFDLNLKLPLSSTS